MSGGVARSRRYDERVDLQLRENVMGGGIIVNDGHVGGQKRNLPVQVPGEAVSA